MALYAPVIAVLLAAFISILAVRALGETDLNPAGGIGKISQAMYECYVVCLSFVMQIVFAVVTPGKVVANIIAGAIAEAGAIQAGDMMQDFKTAHLLGRLLHSRQRDLNGYRRRSAKASILCAVDWILCFCLCLCGRVCALHNCMGGPQ